jgi:ribosomal protein S18 acetylase RimI-like enzyme
VSDQLESFNQFQIGRDDFEPLNLVIRQNGSVIAGLKAMTGWGWMHVQTLWIADEMRRKGLGDRLLRKAEQMARQRNCVGSCLSSFSFQAPEFYLQYGYTKFGSIENYHHEMRLLFLSNRLD